MYPYIISTYILVIVMFITHTDKALWILVIFIPFRESFPTISCLFGSFTSFEVFYPDVSVRFKPLEVYLSCVQIFLLVAQLFMSSEGCHSIGFFKPLSVR